MRRGVEALTWVVGRGGLLGRAVVDAYSDLDRRWVWAPPERIRWDDERESIEQLGAGAMDFLDLASRSGCPWRILWCAGAGVIATAPERLEQETTVFRAFLAALAHRRARAPAVPAGSLFVSASAGGAYAGSSVHPPFDEQSPTGAISAYGREKLRQESLAEGFARATGVALLIGRLSNLYGPGQDLSKPQGLITHVGRAALRREPVHMYVPLDTIRDYLLAGDAARAVRVAMDRLEGSARSAHRPPIVVKILASEVDTSIASVLAAWRHALKRPPRVVLASSPVAQLQPRVLAFRSRVWPEIAMEPTGLLIGVHAVLRAQLAELRAGRL